MPTLDDIAAAVGVSRSTVSRVLNGRDTLVPVSAQTRDRIRSVASELRYQPNLFARGLKTRRSYVIGVAVRNFAYPFWSGILEGVNDACSNHGYHVILTNTSNRDEPEDTVSVLFGRLGADGLVIAGDLNADDATFRRIRAQHPNMVVVCRSFDPAVVPVLRVDDRAGTRRLLEHLWGLGHRRIGFVGLRRSQAFNARYDAYLEFARERGLDPDEALVRQLPSENVLPSTDEFMAIGAELTGAILASGVPVTALVCACDALALGALAAARAVGRRVPDDLSVAGFDDAPFAHYCSPTLTTVHQPTVEMGRDAANLLIGMVEGTADRPAEAVLFDPWVVVRESTAAPPLQPARQ